MASTGPVENLEAYIRKHLKLNEQIQVLVVKAETRDEPEGGVIKVSGKLIAPGILDMGFNATLPPERIINKKK